MLKKMALPIMAAVLTYIAVAMAYYQSQGGITDPHNLIQCLLLYLLLLVALLLWTIRCFLSCENREDPHDCNTRCIWISFWIWIALTILLILCIIYHPF